MQPLLHRKQRIPDILPAERMIARHLEAVFHRQPQIVTHHDGDPPFCRGVTRLKPLLTLVHGGLE